MRVLHVVFLVSFFALCALPTLDRYWAFVPDPGLHGSVATPDPVPLQFRSYYDGSFQTAFEKNFETSLPVRSALVRSDNQLNLSAFHEFSPSAGTALILGKQGNLFEKQYVDDYNRRDEVPTATLEGVVQRLKLLQDYLEARDATLLVVISPSKALLYPELLPEKRVDTERVRRPHKYQVFSRLLNEHGVNVLDAEELLNQAKASSPFPLFATTGGHWDDPAVCAVASEIQKFLHWRLHQPVLSLNCEAYSLKPPVRQDRDLLDLANIWTERARALPVPAVNARTEGPGKVQRPSVLFVGSSFVWRMLDYANQFNLQRHDTFFYYYKTRVGYPVGKNAIDPKRIDWRREVFSRDAVIIEINASVVEHAGWGFLEDAERAIRAN